MSTQVPLSAQPPEPRAAQKAERRAAVRAARRARDADQRAAAGTALAGTALAPGSPLLALPAGAVVAAYESLPTEPGTRPLRAALAGRGLVVVLPVVVGADAPLAWRLDTGQDDDAPFPGGAAGAAAVLLPALAVDRSGVRLGQGGGHYDRTLAALPPGAQRPLLVAVVHDDELLAAGALPREAHDVAVDAALTPSGWHDLR